VLWWRAPEQDGGAPGRVLVRGSRSVAAGGGCRQRLCRAFLGVEKFISVLDYPASEGTHRAVGQALAQLGQPVLNPGRGLGVGAPGDEAVAEQAVQCLFDPNSAIPSVPSPAAPARPTASSAT
jgi:hypothetical protein